MKLDLYYASESRRRPSARLADPIEVIDRNILRQLIEDVGEDAAPEIIDAFREELDLQVDGIRAAYAAGDAPGLARMAHRMKSSAASVGALPLSRVAAALEQAARAGDVGAMDRAMAGFDGLAIASGTGLAAAWHALWLESTA
jgi:HPt (histidine-containing phosphotransfer) domain-containing protein